MDCLRLPAREENLPALRQLALDAAQRAGLDAAACLRVELALEEALVNVIRHAYPPQAQDRPVELSCGARGAAFVLTLTDWGPPFDPVGPEDAGLEAGLEANLEADLEHRAPGGLGLFLIRGMAQASYARQNDANVLTLRFGPGDPA